jgi:2-polyprenyl-3-methyl-5-hydroxy-6-metoxy-1,4-benzoquinol methylase
MGFRRRSSILVRLFGFRATLVHGDTLVLDRWNWLRGRLPVTRNGEQVLDVGCGSGAFSIGAALRGYECLGLSWDAENQDVAQVRAQICAAPGARFEIQDVRSLDAREDLVGRFHIVLCLENIEHILNDRKLIADIARCLRPGGRLLLSTPNLLYRPFTAEYRGPFAEVEDGGHVRKGYSPAMLRELCELSGLRVEAIGYCSGFTSQKITGVMRAVSGRSAALAWVLCLPFRLIPPLVDPCLARVFGWPGFSITLEAYKPRFGS